ncbi:MAG: fumarylacetoacetase [Bacteroidales bacterium]|jgi:fumarylacetoacetase
MNKIIDSGLTSWIEVEKDSDFPIQNIPFGVFRSPGKQPSAGTRIGNTVISLHELSKYSYLKGTGIETRFFNKPILNDFIALGKSSRKKVRERLIELFSKDNPLLRDNLKATKEILFPVDEVEMMIPVKPGDYTDFYSSEQHARNLGTILRDAHRALNPNWKHIPVAYHGRSSSIVISGTHVHRPKGQIISSSSASPEFGPTKQLDFELEVAFITGKPTALGESVKTAKAEDHIFGFVLFNDLSARDIQKWEYTPLGPFQGKDFGSVISPWIVTLDALEPFRTAGPYQDPPVLPYLSFEGNHHFDITLEIFLKTSGNKESRISKTNYKNIYWNIAQQLAHQTVNGCNINAGDIYSSGTISGTTRDSYGSMIELSWAGTRPLRISGGIEREFLEDYDTVIFRGYAEKDGLRIGFGEVSVKILPAKE